MSFIYPALTGTIVVMIEMTSHPVFRHVQTYELVVNDGIDLQVILELEICSAYLSKNCLRS